MPAVEFIYYHNLLPGPLQIHNSGQSVSLILPRDENFTEIPYIFGGKLQAEFEFASLHFHWGDKNNRGAVRYEIIVVKSKQYISNSDVSWKV